MESETWELEFADDGIKIRGAEGVLADLPYPITEGGVLPSENVRRYAHLMRSAPDLLHALERLLNAIPDRKAEDSMRLEAAMYDARVAIGKAKSTGSVGRT